MVADVKFDLTPPRSGSPASSYHSVTSDIIESDDVISDPEISMAKTPSKDWEMDVRGLISTKKWLQNYGLKKNRLDMRHILPQIGFKHADGTFILFRPSCYIDVTMTIVKMLRI